MVADKLSMSMPPGSSLRYNTFSPFSSKPHPSPHSHGNANSQNFHKLLYRNLRLVDSPSTITLPTFGLDSDSAIPQNSEYDRTRARRCLKQFSFSSPHLLFSYDKSALVAYHKVLCCFSCAAAPVHPPSGNNQDCWMV